MDTKANYVAVGAFTLALVLAMFGMIYWSFGVSSTGDTALLRIRIPGSAAGLGRGSSVLFNGIKVGDVRRVYIDVNNPTVAIADAEIDRLTPITESTRADIGLAGLTGQAAIELKGGDPAEQNLLERAEAQGTVAEVTANPSAVTNLLQTAQDIFARADAVLNTLEGFASDVRGPLTSTVGNVEVFSQALSRNAEGVDQFLANFGELSETLGNVSGRLDSTLTAAEELIRAVDREQVGTIVCNVETFTERLQTATADLDRIMANVDEASASVRSLAENANGTLARADGILDGVRTGVDTAVASIGQLSTQASGTLTRADGVLDGVKGGVDTAVASIGELSTQASGTLTAAEELIRAVDRDQVGTIVTNVQTVTERLQTATADLDRIMANVDETSASVRSLAENANGTLARADGILDGVRTGVDTAVASIGQLSTQASGTLTRADGVLDGVRSGIDTTVASIGELSTQASGTLTKVDGVLDSARGGIDSAAASITGVAEQASGTLSRADEIMAVVDPAQVESALTSFEGAAADARKAAADVSAVTSRFAARGEDFDAIIANARSVSQTFAEASTRIDGLVKKVDTIVAGIDAETVNGAVSDFTAAASDARKAAGDVAAFTERFTTDGDVDAILDDARVVAANLRQASTRVDGVLVKIDDLLGSGEAEGLAADASATLASFRTVADTLNARLGSILDNLSRFSGQGLRETEALIRDSRRSINRIEEAVSAFERNPQRIITGGEGNVREFDGRQRR
jgi:phospholipid/cholesterol/gamma-HCH transport system substrate-binding protein